MGLRPVDAARSSWHRPWSDATPPLTHDEALRRFARSRVAHLATIGRDGRPDVVPITFALDGQTVYTGVDHKPKRSRELARLANIERDPRVTLLADRYDDTWSKLWWVRLRGDASVVADGTDLDLGIQALTEKYEQYRRTRLRGPIVVVRVESVLGWAAVG